ncbi:retron St85 family effector protein [Anaerotignum sp.]|uniref:retron St85 family effector protein n=1 Tax=Anaerotignum sp. TaxID=2039241 RepID=UPI0028B19859|nr:retron St85 family effector protein [Anaerotignum sp.]
MKKLEIFTAIFNDVFCKTFSESCYVFLCGGAGREHIRNKIRVYIENNGFQVLYPEDLFMDMLNRDKKADLLEYENLLADNSDIICIICESIGSAVELGAFIQNDRIKQKMIVGINQKFSRDKSFVMMGPVKHLQKTNKDNVIIYKKEEPEVFGENLIKVFHHFHKHSKSNKNQSFNTLSAYIAFIPMVIYFFKTISRRELHKNLKELLKKQQVFPTKYNELFNASIKYLIRSGGIITEFDTSEKDETLSLSPKGYFETHNLLKFSYASNKTMLYDSIRCAILKGQLNN